MRRCLPVVAMLAVLIGCRSGEVTRREPPPARPVPGSRPPTPTSPSMPLRARDVRVGIVVDTSAVQLGATGGLDIRGAQGVSLARAEAGETWTFSADGGQLRARSSRGREVASAGTILTVSPTGDDLITIAGRNFRGAALVRVGNTGRVSAINVLDMETYLRGVVPNEIGRLQPALIEAVKAQAIAARTYAVGNLSRWEQRGFDFYSTVQDQVYRGVTDEDSVANRAVAETRGEIVTHEGRPIQAYYSSTCGGRTAAIQEVWPWRASLPYLRSVPDTMGAGERVYCETSSRYRWTVTWTRDALRRVLQQTLGARAKGTLRIERPDSNDRQNFSRVERVAVTERTASGRAAALHLTVDGQAHRIPADSIRWILRPDSTRSLLNSSLLFEVIPQIENEEVLHLEVRGGGWGHAIGMCQVGAINRARAGQSYRQILLTYYSGTRIERLY